MGIMAPTHIDSQFKRDVLKGLSSFPKFLESKYFYDKRGDELFQEIMGLSEYYLTNCELEILTQNKEKILKEIQPDNFFHLIDLGAGDAFKTKILLKYFVDQGIYFQYVPVDISENAIKKVTKDLQKQMPGIQINGLSKEYHAALHSLPAGNRKVILFLGASIGNFTRQETLSFLRSVSENMSRDDLFIIGLDLKKDPNVVLAAYNDAAGVTKQFNLNLLQRINREMGANFDLNQFDHAPHYSAENGEARSALVSIKNQEVRIPALDLVIELQKGEPIHTEISRKYNLTEIEYMAAASGFEIIENLLDSKHYFTNTIWRKKE